MRTVATADLNLVCNVKDLFVQCSAPAQILLRSTGIVCQSTAAYKNNVFHSCVVGLETVTREERAS